MGHFVDHLSRDVQPKGCHVTVLNTPMKLIAETRHRKYGQVLLCFLSQL